MTIIDQPIGETDLLAYVDGHLDPARRRLVEQYLAENFEAARRVAEDMAIMDGIRALFERYYQEPVPRRLQAALTCAPRDGGRLRRLRRAAAAVTLLAAGVLGGWLVAQDGQAPLMSATHEQQAAVRAVAAQSHARAPAEALGESLRNTLRIPDLSSAGLKLVGQAAVGTADHPAVQLTYEDSRGGRIFLYQQARSDNLGLQAQPRRADGRGLVYWAEGPYAYAMTGEMSSEDLRVLAEAAQGTSTPNQRRDGIVPVVTGRR